jgi:hypothetical protein
LEAIAADRNRPRKHIERTRVVLASADYRPVQQVAEEIGVSRPMVWRWQQRFAEEGVEGLLRDKTRPPGTPRLPPDVVARVVHGQGTVRRPLRRTFHQGIGLIMCNALSHTKFRTLPLRDAP